MIQRYFDFLSFSDTASIENESDISEFLNEMSHKKNRTIAELSYQGDGIYNPGILTIGIDFQRSVGVAMYRGYDSFISQGEKEADVSLLDDGELLYFTNNEPMEFPLDAEVPVKFIEAGIKEFIDGDGTLPSSIPWSDEAP